MLPLRLCLLSPLPAALALAGGCMTVHIETGGRPAQVIRHVGLLHVEVVQPDKAVVGDLHGLGLVLTPMGASAGYTRQRWAAIGPQCRALLWLDGAAPVDERWRQTLTQIAGVCLVPSAMPPGPGARINQESEP